MTKKQLKNYFDEDVKTTGELYEACKDWRKSLSLLDKFKYDVLWKLYHALRLDFVFNIHNEIKYFFQRGIRGYSDRDCWTVDSYLADVIPGMLTNLNKNKSGYPHDLTPSKWAVILRRIIKSFKQAGEMINSNIMDVPLNKKYTLEQHKAHKKFVRDMNKKYSGIYNAKVLTVKEGEDFQRGFDLFKEYFFCLWD